MDNKIYRSEVIHGRKMGKKFGFPTINLADPAILSSHQDGVYAARVSIEGNKYSGLLYKGPRLILGETETILEIYLLNFNQEIYGQTVSFRLLGFIRGVMNFNKPQDLKKQLAKDLRQAKRMIK